VACGKAAGVCARLQHDHGGPASGAFAKSVVQRKGREGKDRERSARCTCRLHALTDEEARIIGDLAGPPRRLGGSNSCRTGTMTVHNSSEYLPDRCQLVPARAHFAWAWHIPPDSSPSPPFPQSTIVRSVLR
jgi:hypothetical protein